jgi:hypothetical protein
MGHKGSKIIVPPGFYPGGLGQALRPGGIPNQVTGQFKRPVVISAKDPAKSPFPGSRPQGLQFLKEASGFRVRKFPVPYALKQGKLFRPVLHSRLGELGFLVPLKDRRGLFQVPALPVYGVQLFHYGLTIHGYPPPSIYSILRFSGIENIRA